MMDLKKKRQQILAAGENAVNELIKVLNKKMDPEEIDPEKVKISASAYRLAMDDAMALMDRITDLKELLDDTPKDKRKEDIFLGAENRAK